MNDAPMVERRARIFRFGDYPEKRWSITREEFVAANGESGTVPIGLDPIGRKHYLGLESVLDGLTGEAAFSVEGDEVYATLRMPALIDTAVRRAGLKISGVFHPTAKSMSKIDLVDTPHIRDAVIFAEGHGLVVLTEDDDPVDFCDDEDGKHHAYQAMHDLASHGRPALCGGHVGFAAAPRESDDDRLIRQIHHHAVHHGAYCPGMPDGHHEEVGMSDENEEVEVQVEEDPAAEVAFSVEEMTPRERALYEMMSRRIERIQEETVEDRAVAFAASLEAPGNRRILPAERQRVIDGYKRAALVDARLPEAVTFTDESGPRQGTHLEAFKSLYSARPRIAVTDPKASGVAKEVGFTALPVEPDEAAAHEAREKARRDRAREENQAWAKGHNANG